MLHLNRFLLFASVGLFLQACSTSEPVSTPSKPGVPQSGASLKNKANLTPVSFSDLKGWRNDDFIGVTAAFQSSCTYFKAQKPSIGAQWINLCQQVQNLSDSDMHSFFESNFTPYQVGKGAPVKGKLTSYATPIVTGSRPPCRHDQTPFYKRPSANIKNLPRADLINGALKGQEVACIDDVADAYESMIQGTTFIKSGVELFSVRPSANNGHSYKSIYPQIGLDMKGLKKIAAKLPNAAKEITTLNPRYIYYTPSADKVLGTLNTPLIAERSLAVDPKYINYGFPIWLSGTKNRLMMAHDTGDAIRGQVRGDYFHGLGDNAMASARKINGSVTFHILVPNNGNDLPLADNTDTPTPELYKPASPQSVTTSSNASTANGHVVQLGVFSNKNSAFKHIKRIKNLNGLSTTFKTTVYGLSNGSYRVLSEGFNDAQQARDYCNELQENSIDCFYKKL